MAIEEIAPNRLRDERLAADFGTPEELAARAGIDPDWYRLIEAGKVLPTTVELEALTVALGGIPIQRLYESSVSRGIPGLMFKIWPDHSHAAETPSEHFQNLADQGHMLVSRDEITWFERQPGREHRVEAYVNLSCGTQKFPNLLLDTVAVLKQLGVSFVAAAGTGACCGKPFVNAGKGEVAERFSRARIERSLSWGARTHVNWCQRCQFISTTAADRRLHADGVEHPVREVQVLTFLAEEIAKLGDRVPWQQDVSRRVLVCEHPAYSAALRDGEEAVAKLLGMVPGVEVVGSYDLVSEDSSWFGGSQEPTTESVRERRARLADEVGSRGADTVSCPVQACHGRWCHHTSEDVAVRHPVSVLAEALGCAHPDRYQAAVRLGDPDEFVAQTRSVWQSWGLDETRARELAESISDPAYADATQCPCDGDRCQGNLVGVDVLAGTLRPPSPAHGSGR